MFNDSEVLSHELGFLAKCSLFCFCGRLAETIRDAKDNVRIGGTNPCFATQKSRSSETMVASRMEDVVSNESQLQFPLQ